MATKRSLEPYDGFRQSTINKLFRLDIPDKVPTLHLDVIANILCLLQPRTFVITATRLCKSLCLKPVIQKRLKEAKIEILIRAFGGVDIRTTIYFEAAFAIKILQPARWRLANIMLQSFKIPPPMNEVTKYILGYSNEEKFKRADREHQRRALVVMKIDLETNLQEGDRILQINWCELIHFPESNLVSTQESNQFPKMEDPILQRFPKTMIAIIDKQKKLMKQDDTKVDWHQVSAVYFIMPPRRLRLLTSDVWKSLT